MPSFEYVGGPLDGGVVGEINNPEMFALVADTGIYAERGTTNLSERVVLRWTPTPGGRRNPPACAQPCSRGCPALTPTTA